MNEQTVAGTVWIETTISRAEKNQKNIEQETIRQEVLGHLYRKKDTIFLRYEEPQSEALKEKIINILKWETKPIKEITLIRLGAINMHHLFQSEKETTSIIKYPYGASTYTTDTKEIKIEEVLGVIKIKVIYQLKLQGSLMGEYNLQISFIEKETIN